MDDIFSDLRRFNTPLRGVRCSGNETAVEEKSTARVKKTKAAPTVRKTNEVHAKTVHAKTVPIGSPLRKTPKLIAAAEPITAEPLLNAYTANVYAEPAQAAGPTLDQIADGVAAPMRVVSRENIDSSIKIACPRGHIHLYLLRDLVNSQPKCKTCSVPGVLAKKVREQVEEVTGLTFSLVERTREYCYYVAGDGPVAKHLYVVKSGYTAPRNDAISLPESQSRSMIGDLLRKQLPDACATPEVKSRPRVDSLPYCEAFAGGFINYRICGNKFLRIENCGWGAK